MKAFTAGIREADQSFVMKVAIIIPYGLCVLFYSVFLNTANSLSTKSIGNNDSVPLLQRLSAGHVVSPRGPVHFRRFKAWLPWYQAYVRWCFQTKVGKRCKGNNCCLWHMECMTEFKEYYAFDQTSRQVSKYDVEENWPKGIFGTGRRREGLVYKTSGYGSLYHRLEMTSTKLANVLSRVRDCPCLEDTSSLDAVFSLCAQSIPGEKGVTRLPRQRFEKRDNTDEERHPEAETRTDALAAVSSLAIVASSLAVCRYYRKPGSSTNITSRTSSILRWRRRQQQQANTFSAERIQAKDITPKPQQKRKTVKSGNRGSASKTMAASGIQNRICISKKKQCAKLRDHQTNAEFAIRKKKPIEWATCPTCDRDFETATGVIIALQKTSLTTSEFQIPAFRYFCSHQCIRRSGIDL